VGSIEARSNNRWARFYVGYLTIGNVHFRFAFCSQTLMTNVACHPYNCPPPLVAKPHSLNERILLVPIGTRHGLINDEAT
jgi:hypothetical protein